MATTLRVIHYVNQFFGGIGAEDKADVGPSHRKGPVGPGIGLAKYLGAEAEVVGTLVCGDNFFVEHEAEAVDALLAMAEDYRADVLVAGPAFTSGRYGTACGTLAAAWTKRGKPAVTAMNASNPGVELFRGEVVIVPTGPTAASNGRSIRTRSICGRSSVSASRNMYRFARRTGSTWRACCSSRRTSTRGGAIPCGFRPTPVRTRRWSTTAGDVAGRVTR